MSLSDVEERIGASSTDTHPVTRLSILAGGEGRVLLAWIGIGLALVFGPADESPLVLVGILVFFGGLLVLSHRGNKSAERTDEVRDLEVRYAEGELSLDELEEQLEIVLDPRTRRVRDFLVEEVDGIGPVLASEVALVYMTVDDLREAEVEELTSVHGIGTERAGEIVDELRETEVEETGGDS